MLMCNGNGKGETKVIYTLHNCNRLYPEIEQWVLESDTKKNQLWQGEGGNRSSLHAQQKENMETYGQEERTEYTLKGRCPKRKSSFVKTEILHLSLRFKDGFVYKTGSTSLFVQAYDLNRGHKNLKSTGYW